MIDYEDDIASDLSVFHRVDDWRALESVTYFARVIRLAAYMGVMAARMEERRKDDDEQTGYVPESVALGMLDEPW